MSRIYNNRFSISKLPVPTILSLAFSLRDFMPSYGIVYSHAEKVFYQEFQWEKCFQK